MLSVSILGNGPSVKFFKNFLFDSDLLIGTNNIFYLRDFFRTKKNKIFTAYDDRLLKNKEWTENVLKFKQKIYFPPEWINHKKFTQKKNIYYNLPKMNNLIVFKYLKLFSDKIDLKTSVILEKAIPLAIACGATRINLFGCEFNYKIDNQNNQTSKTYFYSKKNSEFEHTKKSESIWSELQIRKLKIINKFLLCHNIIIKDFSFSGKLCFLKT